MHVGGYNNSLSIMLGVGYISKYKVYYISRPEISRGYPLNLSILLSGGKENNNDSPSNGE